MSIDEVMLVAEDYSMAVHDGRDADCGRLQKALRAAIEQHVEEAVKAERLAIVMALPGGTIADPQHIADMIRGRGVDEEEMT